MFPKDILGGVSYSIRNGARLARTVLISAPAGSSITTLVVNAEPIGSLSLENVGLLDLRAAKRIQLGQGRTFELRLDCFNALNVNPVTSIVTRAGSDLRERHRLGKRRSERDGADASRGFSRFEDALPSEEELRMRLLKRIAFVAAGLGLCLALPIQQAELRGQQPGARRRPRLAGRPAPGAPAGGRWRYGRRCPSSQSGMRLRIKP